jgi:hypothetical protein
MYNVSTVIYKYADLQAVKGAPLAEALGASGPQTCRHWEPEGPPGAPHRGPVGPPEVRHWGPFLAIGGHFTSKWAPNINTACKRIRLWRQCGGLHWLQIEGLSASHLLNLSCNHGGRSKVCAKAGRGDWKCFCAGNSRRGGRCGC